MENNIDKGFIKLKRTILEWEWYQDANTTRLMIHLLLKSNFKTKNWQGNVISPGELITSLDNLSNELKLSVGMIRNSLKKLKNGKYIATKTTNKFTMIKLLKSSIYDEVNNTSSKQNYIITANEKQTSSIPTTTTNKVKNELETLEKKEIFKKQIFQFQNQFPKEKLESFYNYWSEECRQTGRLKFEDEKFWNLGARISNWKVFGNESTKKEPNNFYLNR